MEEMPKSVRESPDGAQKYAILVKQTYCCMDCGTVLYNPDIDHHKPLRVCTDRVPQEWAAACHNCHTVKAQNEHTSCRP